MVGENGSGDGTDGHSGAPPPTLRPARPEDSGELAALVNRAYGHYLEQIGVVPGPMREDYGRIVAERDATVAEVDGRPAGLLVLGVGDEGFTIENVAVDPARRGSGVGRLLLGHAESEARRAGFDSIALYTHELMAENLGLYERIGYREYERRPIGGFSLVFMRKRLRS